MALSDSARNALRPAVQGMRGKLTSDLEDRLVGMYGVKRDGTFQAISKLPALESDARARETRELLERILPARPTTKLEKERFETAFGAVLRSLAFTHLNRLVAFKLMEHPSRKVLRETVGKGIESRGFKFYLADHPDDETLWRSGQQDAAYRNFLLEQCRALNEEIGLLFDPDDLASRIFPEPSALNDVIRTLNAAELTEIWEHEEAIGWVYRYYTPKELREQARKKSSQPRNSWEMAFRNQFFTPHYVVRFLTDNALGRTWLEMKPDTTLRDRCAMLVVRPDEPIHARPKKDPRRIRVIDPACGSGHFLLYAFDLLEVIYREAWDDPDLGPALQREFGDRETFEARIPASIVEHNLFGIDIDRRAVQLASLTLFLKAKSRSREIRIERSGLVCAEPMPDTGNLFGEFKATELPSTGRAIYAAILDGLREHLALADEAGSLLLAERELARLIAEQHASWRADRERVPMTALFGDGTGSSNGEDVSDEEFWHQLEHRLERLLESYGERAGGAEGAHRRIFARDGAGILRFIDVLRQRYDVVLMNPPFGDPTAASKELLEKSYPNTAGDVYANFIERALAWLTPTGKLGFITNRTWLGLPQFEGLRTKVLGPLGSVDVGADLGSFVLEAQVETVAAVIGRDTTPDRKAPWIRLLKTKEKEAVLAEAVAAYARCGSHRTVYQSSQARFLAFPTGVFGYWVSDQLASQMSTEHSIARQGVDAVVGLQTSDDFRFVRLAWEVPPALVGLERTWAPFAKGGEYAPFFDDVHLVVFWRDNGADIAGFPKAYIRNPRFYGRSGVTWPRRTTSPISPRALPVGCAFGDKGPAAIPRAESSVDALTLLGMLVSKPLRLLLSIRLGAGDDAPGSAAKSYEVGLVRDLPLPALTQEQESTLKLATLAAAQAAKALQVERDETTNGFVASGFLREPTGCSLQVLADARQRRAEDLSATVAKHSAEIDEVMCAALGFSDHDRQVLAEELEPPLEALRADWDRAHDELFVAAFKTKNALPGDQLPGGVEAEVDVRVKTRRKKQIALRGFDALCRIFEASPAALISARRRLGIQREEDLAATAADLISYCVGVAFGRWDVRLAGIAPDLNPFATLSAVARGALIGADGLPLAAAPADYPLPVDQDGILVDISGHSDDIVAAVHRVLRVLWPNEADTIEREASRLLRRPSLRDYFSNTGKGGFWNDHFRRYSKSRRRAPIYWPLQSPQGFYTAWVYYPRLDQDTLPKLLGPKYLAGEIERAKQAIAELRPQDGSTRLRSRQDEKQLGHLDELLTDLEEFASRIQQIIRLQNDRGQTVGWSPDLNDGVSLNAAPLFGLIPWPRKTKRDGKAVSELLALWQDLEAEDYEWAHIAMRYWPDRVTAKCGEDQSLALAHGLDREFFPGLREELREAASRTATDDDLSDSDLPYGADADEEEDDE